jgi:hypothetical protein
MADATLVDRRSQMNAIALPPRAMTPAKSAAFSKFVESSYPPAQADRWPEGIDYESVEVPTPAPREAFKDPLDVLDLLDD